MSAGKLLATKSMKERADIVSLFGTKSTKNSQWYYWSTIFYPYSKYQPSVHFSTVQWLSLSPESKKLYTGTVIH